MGAELEGKVTKKTTETQKCERRRISHDAWVFGVTGNSSSLWCCTYVLHSHPSNELWRRTGTPPSHTHTHDSVSCFKPRSPLSSPANLWLCLPFDAEQIVRSEFTLPNELRAAAQPYKNKPRFVIPENQKQAALRFRVGCQSKANDIFFLGALELHYCLKNYQKHEWVSSVLMADVFLIITNLHGKVYFDIEFSEPPNVD